MTEVSIVSGVLQLGAMGILAWWLIVRQPKEQSHLISAFERTVERVWDQARTEREMAQTRHDEHMDAMHQLIRELRSKT